MTELPRSIQIGPVRYSVITDPARLNRERAQREDSCVTGWIDHLHNEIGIDADRPRIRLQLTLAHEVLHGMVENLNVQELTAGNESFVHALSRLLVDTLQRNPKLVTFLTRTNPD